MSEVTENSFTGGLTAGNTVETLASTDRDEAEGLALHPHPATHSEHIEPHADCAECQPEPQSSVSNTDAVEELLDEENTFDVSRAEFNELRDLVLSIAHGINQHNQGSPHKIPVVSINSVLGIK